MKLHCYLENNNYRDWIGENQLILKGAEKGLKEKSKYNYGYLEAII